jgi:diaminopimelate epimerase
MTEIPFTKMSAAGNDFIIIDNRLHTIAADRGSELAAHLCRRKLSVGADGLILIEESPRADFKWSFFNADGSEAEMCGNGGRCVARYAVINSIAPPTLTFETLAGVIKAEIMGARVKLQLPLPFDLTCDYKLVLDGESYLLNSITVGVPHVVVFVDDLLNTPVVELGRKIRFADHFRPAGTNVNFARIMNDSTIAIRTYERGVEDETLACGTGSVASALITHEKRETKSPVSVRTQGGEALSVHFTKENGNLREVFLEGNADVIYEGKLNTEIF